MKKIPKQAYTSQFKELAVKRLTDRRRLTDDQMPAIIRAIHTELKGAYGSPRMVRAPTESWFNSFKNERVHGLRYATHAEMKAVSFEYIEVFYNRKRQHSTLGYKSPIQYLVRWTSEQNQGMRAA
jgi:transposase InsO family protein